MAGTLTVSYSFPDSVNYATFLAEMQADPHVTITARNDQAWTITIQLALP